MGCSSSKHSKNNDQLRSIGSASSPTAATNGGLSGITYTSRSRNNTSSSRRNRSNNNYDDSISIPTIDSDYNPHNSNFSLSDAGGTVGSQSRLSHGLTINTNMTTNNNHTISAFGSQLSPSIAPNNDEEEDSIERKLYQDVYMRESHQNNNNMMYSMTLSHLIQPPTTTRTYNTAATNINVNATNNNNGYSYDHNNGGRGRIQDETIVIIAPRGKLGVVIDTPTINNNNNNSAGKTTMPIVHAIKDTFPIRSQIRVGDKLLAVDDEDVTCMTAVEVSRLIGRKCEQKERKLTIVRGSGGRGGVIY